MEQKVSQSEKDFRSRIVKTSNEDAVRYAARNEDRQIKYQAENNVVAKAFKKHIEIGASVLDAPCGAGRLTRDLALKGYQLTAADLGAVMVSTTCKLLASEGLDIASDVADVENMPYKNNQFDAVVCFRLFHHYPDSESRASLVNELCRVSNDHVLISYNTSFSFSALKNKIRFLTTGKIIKKYATPLSEVKVYFKDNGFTLIKDYARLPFGDSLHFSVFKRV